MREVQIVIRDDLDGTPGADTYSFAWLGTEYEVDLSEAHFKELAELLQPYLAVARPATGTKRARKRSASDKSDQSGHAYRYLPNKIVRARQADIKRVRDWALANGYKVGSRSRIPNDVHTAYNEAHPDKPVPNSNDWSAQVREG